MITAINADNATQYRSLFSEAEDMLRGYRSVTVFDTEVTEYFIKNGDNFEVLTLKDGEELINRFFLTINGDPENKIPGQKVYVQTGSGDPNRIVRITSLEEYFHYLPELLATDEQGNKIPTKFAILPLDEPHFIINANTRAINIPADFKKNGVAVQGDDLAEIVYFEIDRFFDSMDLNNCDILIQWETPKGPKGVIKGVSKEYVRDIESKPGKLIFGWAIEKEITEASGNLKLSVKFYETDDVTNAMVYNFNTLTATVAIYPSIGLDLSQEGSYVVIGDAATSLLERLEPSVIIGNSEAAEPVFLDYPYGEEAEGVDGYDVGEDGDLDIFALARSTDTGVISYDWRKRELSLDNEPTGSIKTVKYDSEFKYVPVTIAELKADVNAKHRIIYTELDGSYGNPVAGNTVVENEEIYKEKKLFEQKAVFVVTGPGIYSVRAKNRIANSLKAKSSTDDGADKIAIFKRPEDVVMNNAGQTFNMHFIGDVTNELAPKFNDEKPGTCTYQWFQARETVNGAPAINNLASGRVSFTDLPDGAKISYGVNAIRVSVPNVFSSKQYKYLTNPESAPTHPDYKPQKHYATFKIEAPANAVYFFETQTSLLSGKVTIDEKPIKLTDKGHPRHRVCWLSVGENINPAENKYSYFGKDSAAGWIENLEWYDAEMNLISIDEIRIDYLSEDDYTPFYQYDLVQGAQDRVFIPSTPGIYHLEVTRERNNDTKVGVSMDYRVTNLPTQPVLAVEGANEEYLSEVNAGKYKFEISLNKQDVDNYLVKIMRQHTKDDKDADFIVSDTIKSGIKETITIDPLTFIDKINAHNVEFNEELGLDGKYYAVITTVLNGKDSAPLVTEGLLDWTIVED